jgi:hypothetical protein
MRLSDLINNVDRTLYHENVDTFLLELNNNNFQHLVLQEYYKDRTKLKQDLKSENNLKLHEFIYDILNMFPSTFKISYNKFVFNTTVFNNIDETFLDKFMNENEKYIGMFKELDSTTAIEVKLPNVNIQKFKLSKSDNLIQTIDGTEYKLQPLIVNRVAIYYDLPMYSALTKYFNFKKPDTHVELIEVLDLLTKDLSILMPVSAIGRGRPSRGSGGLSRGRGRDSLRRQSAHFEDPANYAEIYDVSMGFGGNVRRERGRGGRGRDHNNHYDMKTPGGRGGRGIGSVSGRGRGTGSVSGRGTGSGSGSIVAGTVVYDSKDYNLQGKQSSGRGSETINNATYGSMESGQESSTEDLYTPLLPRIGDPVYFKDENEDNPRSIFLITNIDDNGNAELLFKGNWDFINETYEMSDDNSYTNAAVDELVIIEYLIKAAMKSEALKAGDSEEDSEKAYVNPPAIPTSPIKPNDFVYFTDQKGENILQIYQIIKLNDDNSGQIQYVADLNVSTENSHDISNGAISDFYNVNVFTIAPH